MSLDEGVVGIIEISKNLYGPHQLDGIGFPIRIGSMTSFLSPIEIQHAMLKRDSYTSNLRNEYVKMSSSKRMKTVTDHVSEVIKELGFSNYELSEYGGGYGDRNFYQPCEFIVCKKHINDKEYDFNLTVNERGYKTDLFRLSFSAEGFLKDVNIPKPIFINFFTSNVVSSYFNNLLKSGKSITKIPVNNNIIYFGLGEGFRLTRILNYALYLPKFYISKIKSKDDITIKIKTILNWIGQNQELFDDIFDFYSTIKTR